MRPIKFRAWDIDKKQMKGKSDFVGLFEDYAIEDLNNLFTQGGIEWMQFTGLLDKNGKEIYEGDIVKFFTWRREIVSPVEWCESGVWLPFNDGEYIQDEQGEHFDYKKGFEVIGNIYENPDLLLKEKSI